jgi:seryl-tRNA synthetase
MLDLKFVLANLETVQRAIDDKSAANEFTDLKKLASLEEQRKTAIQEVEKLKAEKNKLSKDIGARMGQLKAAGSDPEKFKAINTEIGELQTKSKSLNDRIQQLENDQSRIEKERDEILQWLPNIPHSSVPPGKSPADNKIVRTWGTEKTFDFAAKAHFELGANLGILDTERGSKVTGSGWYYLRNDGARLERALFTWALDVHRTRNGYEELFPPFFVTEKTLFGSGQFPKFREQMYHANEDDLYAIPTAEVPLTAFHRDETLEEKELPKKYVAYSACFRREAGAAGADTRGIQRVHQFNKVEMFKLATPQTSYDEHEKMVENGEFFLKELGLPYRVVLLCRGDLGFHATKCYDLEVYAPVAKRWLEVSSVSNFEEFQARRSNLRYRPTDGGKLQYLHTINGSGIALPRITVALWEHYQQPDGSIAIPAVLQKYMDGQTHIKKA